jgi:hypothetical protein
LRLISFFLFETIGKRKFLLARISQQIKKKKWRKKRRRKEIEKKKKKKKRKEKEKEKEIRREIEIGRIATDIEKRKGIKKEITKIEIVKEKRTEVGEITETEIAKGKRTESTEIVIVIVIVIVIEKERRIEAVKEKEITKIEITETEIVIEKTETRVVIKIEKKKKRRNIRSTTSKMSITTKQNMNSSIMRRFRMIKKDTMKVIHMKETRSGTEGKETTNNVLIVA